MTRRTERSTVNERYVHSCNALARVGLAIGLQIRGSRTRSGSTSSCKHWPNAKHSEEDVLGKLQDQLSLSMMDLSPQTVLVASKCAALLAFASLAAASVIALAILGYSFGFLLAALCPVVYWATAAAIKGHPATAARRRAMNLIRHSISASNLMIMSLRQDPSLPKAIRFAARNKSEYANELNQSVWHVIMGTHSSFEDSLLALGSRWSGYASEIKSSIVSMITASSESSEEGRRRALERANGSMVTGAKRRIEEYALSLSTPSMILFGLGILLPIMIGSFLPILSWDLWSLEPSDYKEPSAGGSGGMLQAAFFMNVLFPAIAFLIAANAITNHPLMAKSRPSIRKRGTALRSLAAATVATCLVLVASATVAKGPFSHMVVLFGLTVPFSFWLLSVGKDPDHDMTGGAAEAEDELFKVGSKMLEGGNFESTLASVAGECRPGEDSLLRRLAFRVNMMGQDVSRAAGLEHRSIADTNATAALAIVHEAACKDEATAGLLAMDLATYLRDLRSLDETLRSRLRPTVSMMKTTAHFLGPVVLGVTYVMYLTLSSMASGGSGIGDAGLFFLVLGVFLAEINAVVVYFVWGIEGKQSAAVLARSTGICILLSELVFATTAVLAS
ncbi:MAG TPA: hypothetical protein VGB78_00415 [Thermoplasmata archaeon]